MKRLAASLTVLALGAAASVPVRAQDVIPRAVAGDRYLRMAERSPFAPPAPVSAVVGPTPVPAGPKWSDQLIVTLLTQQGSVYLATIKDKSNGEHFLLQSNKEDTERQLVVTGVQWGETTDLTTVTVRHGNDVATLRFEPGAATAVPTANVPVPGRGLGVAPFPATGGIPPRPPMAPPAPPNTSNLVRRAMPIRTTPTVAAPVRPLSSAPRRPVVNKEDEDDE